MTASATTRAVRDEPARKRPSRLSGPAGRRVPVVQTVALCAFVGALTSVRPVVGVLTGGTFLALTALRVPSGVPRSLLVLLPAYFLSAFGPLWLGMVIQIGLVIVTVARVLQARGDRPLGVPVLSALIIAWWLVLMITLSNVPSLSTGVLGVRKSAFAFVGLALGWTCPPSARDKVERAVVFVLATALALSYAMHVHFPALENRVVRWAGSATGQFEGHARLQGLFAGPFHVSLAASFLCVWAVFRFRRAPVLSVLAGVAGVVSLSGAAVRTGYVAFAFACLCVALASSIGVRAKRLYALALVGIVATLLFSNGVVEPTGAGRTALALSSDSRFQARIPQMADAVRLIRESPFVGWGPGAAGDAMGDLFGPYFVHVTAHNVLLKFGVEGGLVGLALVVLLLGHLIRRVDRSTPAGMTAVMAGAVMAAFGLSGSMIEALPVTFVLFVLIGGAVE